MGRSGVPFKFADSFGATQTPDTEDIELAGGCGIGLRGVKDDIGNYDQ